MATFITVLTIKLLSRDLFSTKHTDFTHNHFFSVWTLQGYLYQNKFPIVVVVVSFISTEYSNGTIPGKRKHFVDIRKHIETLLHLPVVTREATGLIKLATKTHKI